jgi:myo-inositol-1(or 4)-monophosphatase
MPINKAQNLEKYLAIATQAALDGGEILRKYWGKLEHIEEKGGSGDLVTEADKQSEKIILDLLQSNFPEHQILAEESGIIGNENSEYLWAIDPLDGTTNYAHGYPVCAVSIGLLINGSPQVGVIYNPFRDELFQGVMGQGASLNHSVIRVSSTDELSKSLLVSGFAYDRCQTEDNNYREFCHLTHLTQGVRRSGSAAIDLSDVACGRLDGYWERGINPWDMVAGIVLVKEAGGCISAYDQSPIDLNSGRILATNGKIHGSLSDTLMNTPSLPLIH